MMIGRVTRVGADGMYVQLQGAGSYEVLAKHWARVVRNDNPGPGYATQAPKAGDLVALDELKAQPGEHVIVAVLA